MLSLIAGVHQASAQLTNSVYGFYWTAYPGAGCFATNVNGFANIAYLQWNVQSDADRIIACNSKLMLDTTWVFWDGTNSLNPNYQTTWNAYKAQLTPYYISQIAAFYVMDEPYLHGLTPAQLQTAVACIKADFPNIPVAVTFAYPSLTNFNSSSWIPTNLDWISVDAYGDFSAIGGLVSTLETYKQPNQKLFLTPQGYLSTGNANAVTDATVAGWSYDYNDLYLADPQIMGQLTFLCRGSREYVFPSDGPMPLTYAAQQTIGTEVLKMGNSFKRGFSDMFESASSFATNWSSVGAWVRATTKARTGNYSAKVTGSVTDSALTSQAINVGLSTTASINFWWYIQGLASGEYIRCDYKLDNGAWTQVASLDGGGSSGSQWLHVIASDLNVSGATNLYIRFRGTMSSSGKYACVDCVNVCEWGNPTMTAWPTASTITSGQTLASSMLSGGSAAPAGTFNWAVPLTVPPLGTSMQSVIYTPNDTGNYNRIRGSVSITITTSPTTTSLSASVNPSTYGGAVTFTAIVRTPNGIPTGTVTFKDGGTPLGAVVLPNGFGNSATAALRLTNLTATTHSLTASYGGDNNFSGNSSSALSQGVNLKPLTVAGVTAGNKIYDGTTNVALSGTAALGGVISGDTVTLGGTASASFTNKDVGTGKPVSVSGYTLGGASATNYSLTQPALSANITARPVTLSGSRVYDGTTAASAAILTIGNNVDGVNLTLSGSGTLAGANVGTQAISGGTLALGGSAAGNYTVVGLSGPVTISASSSTTALAGSLNPSLPGTNVIFTATVGAVPPGSGTPTNAVQFLTNGIAAALVNLNGSAHAAFATSLLPHGSTVVTAIYVSDGNFLASTNSMVQVVNTPPVAKAFMLGAVSGLPTTLQIIGGTNAPTDADDDPMTVAAVSSAGNGIASTDGTNVTYTATNSFAGTDSFSYTVSDKYGATATNIVTVNVIASSVNWNQMTVGLSGGNVVLTYLGIPWNNYALEQTFTLSPPVWMPMVTNLAYANGYLMFTNPPQAGTNSFWRIRHVP